MYRKNQPAGYKSLQAQFESLVHELRSMAAASRQAQALPDSELSRAAGHFRQASSILRQATGAARQALQALAKPVVTGGTSARAASGCPGGVCPAGSAAAGNPGGSAGVAAVPGWGATLSSSLGTAIKSAVTGDLARALQSMLSSVVRSIAGAIGRSAGGGIGGGLVATLVGTGLSLLLGKLFRRRQSVQVENTVRSEVLNFPRLLSLDFASNPASRLFGSRAVARGPAFYVEVRYRDGAEDIVSAKIASHLADMNLQQGLG